MSKITLGGVELPKQTGFPKLKYEPITLYSNPSVTGRLHNVYQRYFNKQLELDTVLFERVFTFEIVNIDEPTYNQLNAIDGTNCVLRFERDTYTEEYIGNLDCTFFKFDEHNYFDAVNIEFTVTSQVPLGGISLMWIGFAITPPVDPNNSLMWIGETYVPSAPTITKVDNTIVME